MLLTDDFLHNWERIVNDIDKHHVPLPCVKKVVFRNKNRSQKTINLRRLRERGQTEEDIDHVIQHYIVDNENDILSMEFVLDIEAVAEQIQPETDKLLRSMR